MAANANMALPGIHELVVEGESDPTFLDDLIAANHFKTFLLGRGIDLPPELMTGLNVLMTAFQDDVAMYRKMSQQRRPVQESLWPWRRGNGA